MKWTHSRVSYYIDKRKNKTGTKIFDDWFKFLLQSLESEKEKKRKLKHTLLKMHQCNNVSRQKWIHWNEIDEPHIHITTHSLVTCFRFI